MHDLWKQCQKLWDQLDVKNRNGGDVEFRHHKKHGHLMSLMHNPDPQRLMFLLCGELQTVIVYFDPTQFGRAKSDVIDGASLDRVQAFLKKYTS